MAKEELLKKDLIKDLYASCPHVSHISNFNILFWYFTTNGKYSNPIVAAIFSRNSPDVALYVKQVFPTPESPIIIIL